MLAGPPLVITASLSRYSLIIPLICKVVGFLTTHRPRSRLRRNGEARACEQALTGGAHASPAPPPCLGAHAAPTPPSCPGAHACCVLVLVSSTTPLPSFTPHRLCPAAALSASGSRVREKMVPPVNVSPLIKAGRYSALLLGIVYGSRRYGLAPDLTYPDSLWVGKAYLKPQAEKERKLEAEQKKKEEEMKKAQQKLEEAQSDSIFK
ncbi:ATP synthase F(0) complex subunit e, mitochondrial [Phascolarctos cinereus]|uniref:ATP synthase F(0) complex subunit e, mitochondrial n=1 Tax=Phascolarctos cinereus TaxID=38626 RepID=A0A6P5LXX1_PHACI|nr:ATP synthase subunit e, mitochondrial [Phascolarctos cinereus]